MGAFAIAKSKFSPGVLNVQNFGIVLISSVLSFGQWTKVILEDIFIQTLRVSKSNLDLIIDLEYLVIFASRIRN